MKPTELRIGSWYNSVKFGNAVKCELVDLYDLCANSEGAFNNPPIDKMFTPILLDESWLVKFGFTKRKSKFENIVLDYWVHECVCLFFNESPPEDTYLIGYGFTFDGKYYASTFNNQWITEVHTLQNLYFALTGEELTIK